MTYHAMCSECKNKRKYEGHSLGDCIKTMERDGWSMMPNTKLLCGVCNKGSERHDTKES